ncbi:MAG: cyanophycin synthetase [Vampirovibrionales bacterium]
MLPASIADSLNRFTGMGRRFEVLGEYNGALVVDDYAHHPTELQVTLSAARQRQRYHAASPERSVWRRALDRTAAAAPVHAGTYVMAGIT